MQIPNVTLNNSKSMPAIGLGTWRSDPESVKAAVKDAIDIGYRHFDCAHIYGNEKQVGEAIEEKIADGSIKREDLFITGKLWNTHHEPGIVRQACEVSLSDLRLQYLDNYLMHWPMAYKGGNELYPKDESGKIIFSDVHFGDTWRAMEQLVDDGLVYNIGVSNFNKSQLECLLYRGRIPPANLQIECHPYLNQKRLIDFCRGKNIIVTAYSPLGSGHSPYEKPGDYPILCNPVVLNIADSSKRSPAQILIRYQIQRGLAVIPRSITKEHLISNLQICDFHISAVDMQKLDGLDINGRFNTIASALGHPHYPFGRDDI